MKTKRILTVLIVLLLSVSSLFAQEAEKKTRGDYLTVKIVLLGPGDDVYFWWGHLAVIIQDEFTGTSHFVDYGVFSFDNEDFFINFAKGRLVFTTRDTIAPQNIIFDYYKSVDRSVTVYTLDLSSEQKEEVLRITENNLKPENRDYLYNHFKDNCVTRITDTLDVVVGGDFYKKTASMPGEFTLREEIRRFVNGHPVWDIILNFLMGQVIDTKISVKEEMFLPEEAAKQIEDFVYTDASGNKQKLVKSVEKIYIAKRAPFLDAPRSNYLSSLIAGIIIAVILLLFRYIKNPAISRVLIGTSNAVFGLIMGIAGSLLFFMEFFTEHDYTFENSNVLFVNPLLLIAIPFGILLAVGKKNVKFYAKVLQILWTYVFIAALLALLIKILPGYYQDNNAVLLLVVPLSLVQSVLPVIFKKLVFQKKLSS
jgi:hypothetical protein